MQEQSTASSPGSCSGDRVLARGVYDGPSAASKLQPGLTLRAKVAKLLDSYLAEVARDSKLPLSKFQFLAEALPEGSRLCDDGLYRAVDTYLKVSEQLMEGKFCVIVALGAVWLTSLRGGNDSDVYVSWLCRSIRH